MLAHLGSDLQLSEMMQIQFYSLEHLMHRMHVHTIKIYLVICVYLLYYDISQSNLEHSSQSTALGVR